MYTKFHKESRRYLFKNSREKCIHPDTHVKKSQPLILITYQRKKNRHKTQVYWTHSDSEINFTALTLLQLS